MKTANDQFNEQETNVLLRELEAVLKNGTEGDVVELGCYKGATSVLMQRAIGKWSPGKRLYLYDSFEGLPRKSQQDQSPAGEQFRAGELPASKGEVIRRFKQTALPLPVIHECWFGDLTNKDLPDKISFAFLDGDFYESIRDSLKLVWPKLSTGATVVIDDYSNEALPGVQKAVDEWLKTHPVQLRVEASLAIIKV